MDEDATADDSLSDDAVEAARGDEGDGDGEESAGTGWLVWFVLLILVWLGCTAFLGLTGDPPLSGDDGDATNLFGNPGSESWASMNVGVWELNSATLSQESEKVMEGDLSARFASEQYGSVGQRVTFSPALEPGDCLLFRAQVAYVDGDTAPPAGLMTWTDEANEDHLAGQAMLGWILDGEFHHAEALIVPEGTVTWADVFFSAPADPTTWLLDDASLTRIACP